MKFYFRLQYRRIKRIIDATGFNPYIGIVLIGFIFIITSNKVFENIEYPRIIYSIIGLFSLGKLSSKKRNDFLKIPYNSIGYREIRLIENLIIATPFAIFLIYKQEYLTALVFTVIALFLSQKNNLGNLNFVIPTPFFKKPFEYIVGFRKTFWIYPIAYFVTYMAITVQNFNLALFSILVVILVPLSFYLKSEPVFYVWINSETTSEFLYNKIKTSIIFGSFLALPIIVSSLIFFPSENMDTILLISILGLLLHIPNIFRKYSSFPSETPIHGVFLMLSIIFPPFLLFTVPYFYSRANKNLKKILK